MIVLFVSRSLNSSKTIAARRLRKSAVLTSDNWDNAGLERAGHRVTSAATPEPVPCADVNCSLSGDSLKESNMKSMITGPGNLTPLLRIEPVSGIFVLLCFIGLVASSCAVSPGGTSGLYTAVSQEGPGQTVYLPATGNG